MRAIFIYLFLLLFSGNVKAQDSLSVKSKPIQSTTLRYSRLLLPAGLITTGAILKINSLENTIQESSRKLFHKNFNTKIDNYTQYVPFVLIFSGNLLGFESKNGYEQMGKNTLISAMITGSVIFIAKKSFRNLRPDHSARNSYPSGHSALAFNLATMQFLEYKDSNIWYASSGFLFASATAIMRMANNRHWSGDIVTGAGLGIGIAVIVDCWNPMSKLSFQSSDKKYAFTSYPFINQDHYGIGINVNIR